MPVFDTPINTDDRNLSKVLKQTLPVLLYLYDRPDKGLESAFRQAAKDYSGELLVAQVDVSSNPETYARFDRPPLPAILTIDGGEVESCAGGIRKEDIEDHVDFLRGMGPLPQETAAQAEARAASGAAPFPVSDATFQRDVLDSDVPVLVDFWAPWCGPCHMVAPVLDELAGVYAGKVKVAKLNVDENRMRAMQYQAMSIPMLLIFKGGEPVGKLVGAHPRPNIERLIQQALN